MDGIVEVARILVVYRHQRHAGEIGAAGRVRQPRGLRLGQHFGRERLLDPVLQEGERRERARSVMAAQLLDHPYRTPLLRPAGHYRGTHDVAGDRAGSLRYDESPVPSPVRGAQHQRSVFLRDNAQHVPGRSGQPAHDAGQIAPLSRRPEPHQQLGARRGERARPRFVNDDFRRGHALASCQARKKFAVFRAPGHLDDRHFRRPRSDAPSAATV